jgi:hypothetical protein
MAWNVVILGGGFGGLYAARKLERELPPQAASRDTSELGQLGHPPPLDTKSGRRRFEPAETTEASGTGPH